MNVDLSGQQIAVVVVLVVWELIWKGLAMWRAAGRREPYWFAGLLIANTAGMLPMIYLSSTSPKNDAAKNAKA